MQPYGIDCVCGAGGGGECGRGGMSDDLFSNKCMSHTSWDPTGYQTSYIVDACVLRGKQPANIHVLVYA